MIDIGRNGRYRNTVGLGTDKTVCGDADGASLCLQAGKEIDSAFDRRTALRIVTDEEIIHFSRGHGGDMSRIGKTDKAVEGVCIVTGMIGGAVGRSGDIVDAAGFPCIREAAAADYFDTVARISRDYEGGIEGIGGAVIIVGRFKEGFIEIEEYDWFHWRLL